MKANVVARGNFHAKRMGGGTEESISSGEVLIVVFQNDKVIHLLKETDNQDEHPIVMIKNAPLYKLYIGS